jgi:RNA polymerase sigma-70 factor (ECF subfamily)
MSMDRRHFARLLAERKDAVYGLAVSLLKDLEDAEDVTQEVFVKLWRQGDEVEEAARAAWLMRVCRNACLDRLRRRKVRRRHQADPARTVVGVGPFDEEESSGREPSFDLSDEGADAHAIQRRAEVQEVVAVMEGLPEPHRSVILLRELHDLPYEEIAQALSLSLASVKVTLHRARRRVREELTSGRGAVA